MKWSLKTYYDTVKRFRIYGRSTININDKKNILLFTLNELCALKIYINCLNILIDCL